MENMRSGARRMHTDTILKWTTKSNIEITDSQLKKLTAYQERVLTVNEYMNLTTITKSEDFAIKHIIDSLTLLPYMDENNEINNKHILDIGTGAGFPGIVLGIMRPNLRLTLMDTLRKRVHFLQETIELLELPQIECIHANVQEYSMQKKYHNKYDICTARAVAKLDKLVMYALPLLKPNGKLLAMKGTNISQELENAKPALIKRKGVIVDVSLVELSPELTHSIVIVERVPTKPKNEKTNI